MRSRFTCLAATGGSRGERREKNRGQESNDSDRKRILCRHYGTPFAYNRKFYWAIRLPDYVKKNGLSAKFADGILTVRIPKSEEAKKEPVAIPIQ